VHGFRGNDQVRMEMGIAALSELRTIVPLRDWGLTDEEVAAHARAHRIPETFGCGNPYSTSENLWGRSIECGPLEDAWNSAPAETLARVAPPAAWPDTPARVVVGFEAGVPVSLDGERLPLAALVERLDRLAGRHGVGLVDTVEDGLVGIKSRAIYEAPGAQCLLAAHADLERFVCDRHENRMKEAIDREWARLVYDGLWFDPLRAHLDAFIDSMNRPVTGQVRLRLHRGALVVEGRRAARGVYRAEEAIYRFGDTDRGHGAGDAAAFARVHNLHTRAAARRDHRPGGHR
jgi:argininosuccinate synthase